MVEIFLFLIGQVTLSQSQYFLIGEEEMKLAFWNNSKRFSERKNTDAILSLHYDVNTSKIYAGTKNKKIIEYSFTDKTYKNILSETEENEVSTVLKINTTHLASAYKENIAIIDIRDKSKRGIQKQKSLGKLRSMIIIKEKNVLVVGSDDKKSTFVYCLNQNKIISSKFLESSIYAIDSLSEEFIVNECYIDFVCLLGLNSSNDLIELKKTNLKGKIFGIEIVNEKFALLACERFLAVWNIEIDKVLIYTKGMKEYKLTFIKIFDNETFGVIHDNKEVDVWILSSLKFKETWNVNSKKVLSFEKVFFKNNNYRNLEINTKEGIFVDDFRTELSISTTITTTTTTTTTDSSTPLITNRITNTGTKSTVITTYSSTSLTTGIIIDTTTESTTTTTDSSTTTTDSSTPLIPEGITTTTTTSIAPTTDISTLLTTESTSKTTTTTTTTTTTEVITPTITENIMTLLKSNESFFYFDDKNLKKIVELITSKIDVNYCIQNCSNNGKCKVLDSLKYVCECNENYVGSTCQYKTLPCSSNPCLYNGTCENILLENSYKCECLKDKNQNEIYYGQNCEFKSNPCQNETCSNNGYCFDSENNAKCKCFSMFSGEKCEIKSKEIIVIEA
ncbi:unnamed protein product, partial [Brachionus calyciflorus]